MNDIKIFENAEFGSIRTVEIEGEPWFVGKDIAEVLGYTNPRKAIIDHIDEEDKTDGVTIRDSIGREQNPVCINESGLYSLILSSKLPKAKQFKHWVTSEVLPTIRKTGGYVNNEDLFINTYLPFANEQTKLLFHSTLEVINSLNAKIKADKPKVEFAEHVASDPYGMRMREFAKVCCDNGIETGEKRLYKFLRDNKYLDKNNIPYQCYIDRGYFKVKEVLAGNTGIVKPVARITGRGQQYFLRKLKESFVS